MLARDHRLSGSDIVFRTGLLLAAVVAAADAGIAVDSSLGGLVVHGGCALAGLGAAITLLLWALVLGWLGLVFVLTGAGVTVVWFKYDVGAGLLFAASIAVLVTVGLLGPSDHGELRVTAWIVVLAIAPVLIVAVLLWIWAARSRRLRERIAILVAVAVCLAPVVWLGASGLSRDVVMASTAPPPVLTGGCGPSTG